MGRRRAAWERTMRYERAAQHDRSPQRGRERLPEPASRTPLDAGEPDEPVTEGRSGDDHPDVHLGELWLPTAVYGEETRDTERRHHELEALGAVARAREDLAEARRALALDTGADLDAWLEEAATLERIHTELVATRKLAEKKSHVPERRFVVGLEMGERLSLERLGLQRYEQLADRRAEIEALRAELADERTRDEVLADDLGSVEMAEAELAAARELLARARGNDRLPARRQDVS